MTVLKDAGGFAVAVNESCEKACAAIAPAWPLDGAIAVNPHWGRIGKPVRDVAARLAVLGGVNVYPSREFFHRAWTEGRIVSADLRSALAQLGTDEVKDLDEDKCRAALNASAAITRLPLLIDLLDDNPGREHHLPWRSAITHQVSQTCAAYFDAHQADWRPEHRNGLYRFWRETLLHDHGIGILMGLPDLSRRLATLPATAGEAERWAMEKLGLPRAAWADYLEAVLLTVNGWASWCAYLRWQATLSGGSDAHLRELLAIRLAWGTVLLSGDLSSKTREAFLDLKTSWSRADEAFAQARESLLVEEIWQTALEAGYQRRLAHQLAQVPVARGASAAGAAPDAQAVFCIDVRSEPLRRAIESVQSGVQTVGFAGFFGLPIAYSPIGTSLRRPQLPGLLAPKMEVLDAVISSESTQDPEFTLEATRESRARSFADGMRWESARRWPAAAFSFVEAFGWAYGAKLSRWLRTKPAARRRDDLAGLPAKASAVCRPSLRHLPVLDRVDLAARVLHAMGLETELAPIVLLVGHGGQSANNPHAAGLDCGACCGQTGEVNARVLADLLNNGDVRAGLSNKGIRIPEATWFVAALHNTTTDELEWFDLDLLPSFAAPHVDKLKVSFNTALEQVRRERAPHLGFNPDEGAAALLARYKRRASDGAQTRPEWGLAGNAAFIIAPRGKTRGLRLDGRAFLHDYDSAKDEDGSVLELLMTAPMLVTNWINWQYHASTCEPMYYGSGNKVLHNVVGGRIGVFEGNGGDLRIGLSKQSLHNGLKWVHEPLRLSVVIDAPREKIESVISRHAVVRELLQNGWLHLWQLGDGEIVRYAGGQWRRTDFGENSGSPISNAVTAAAGL